MKTLLALAAACVLLIVSAAILLTRRNFGSTLVAVGIGCFGVVALTHVFEGFSILPAFGWGQPHSVGHFIDLGAALLGVVFVVSSFVTRYRIGL